MLFYFFLVYRLNVCKLENTSIVNEQTKNEMSELILPSKLRIIKEVSTLEPNYIIIH